ncbi:MAG: nitrate- and nitrite sensing domain-containing protein [Magnetococcus sp. YQC-3]
MKFTESLPFQIKLILILVIPMIGICGFVTLGMHEKLSVIERMDQISRLSGLISQISMFAHEIQKERGMSSGFLGSRGANFRNELYKQRIQTDNAFEQLKELSDLFANEHTTKIGQASLDAFNSYQQIDGMRSRVDHLETSVQDELRFYSQINEHFIDLIDYLSSISNDIRFSNLVRNYGTFLQGKERVGIERAIVVNVLTSGTFGPGMYRKFTTVISEQETIFRIFRSLADQDDMELFDQKMSDPSVHKTHKMRETIISQGYDNAAYVLFSQLNYYMALRGTYHSIKNLLIRGSLYGYQDDSFNPEQNQVKYKNQFNDNYYAIKKLVENIHELSPDEISPDELNDVNTVWNNIQEYYKSVDIIIDLQKQGKHIHEIDQNVQAGVKIDDTDANAAIQRLMESRLGFRFNIDPKDWFNTITTKIELLKAVDDHLINDLIHYSLASREEAGNGFIQYMLFCLTIIVASFVFGMFMTVQVRNKTKMVLEQSDRIAEGDLKARIPIANGEAMDELDRVACSMNVMAESLEKSTRSHMRAMDLRSATSEILQYSLQPFTLQEILSRALEIILAIPWLGVEQRGAIFLYNTSTEQLELFVHKSLSAPLLSLCQQVPLGHCLCGRSAASGEVVMSRDLDERHDTTFPGIAPHGHYCVPILSNQNKLGVLNVYLPAGHTFDEAEVVFLKNIADTLAGLIARRLAEKKITQLSRALEQSPVAILITDATGHVEYINPRFVSLTGYGQEEIIGENILLLKFAEDLHAQNIFKKVMSHSWEWSGALHSQKKTGEMFWEYVSLSPVLDPTQKTTHYIFISEDITEKKEAEAFREQMLSTLDAKVLERTIELNQKIQELEETRDGLMESEKMASLGRLVSGIAHEVNTPIGVAYSASTQLIEESRNIGTMIQQEEVEVEDLLRSVAIVEEASTLVSRNLQRAAELIQSFKQASIDQTSEAVREYHVCSVVQDVMVTLRNQFRKTPISIEVDCPEGLKVVGNPGYLNQILTNMLINSLIHGFAGGTSPGLISMRFIKRRNTLHFYYGDSGAGMSAEAKERAFEPFFTTNRGAGGSGLGLYICYNLITTKLHGSVTLSSAPGKGVQFVCQWPVTVKNLR